MANQAAELAEKFREWEKKIGNPFLAAVMATLDDEGTPHQMKNHWGIFALLKGFEIGWNLYIGYRNAGMGVEESEKYFENHYEEAIEIITDVNRKLFPEGNAK